jgi:hypothetical protein
MYRAFSAAYSLQKELQGQGGLPRAGVALNQIEAIAGQSFSQNFIKSFDAGMQTCIDGRQDGRFIHTRTPAFLPDIWSD